MLSTVATHAARNSRSAEGVRPKGSPVTAGLVETHAVTTVSKKAKIGSNKYFLDMILVFEMYYKYIKPEQKPILIERYYIFTPVFITG
jgi:hypothetical protein